MHIPTFVFIFILFLKNILLLLLYPKHVIKLLGYNLGCYTTALRPDPMRVHQEVLLEDRLLLIASIVGRIIKKNVGNLQVLV